MTTKYNNVYLKETGLVVGKHESEGPLSKYFDNHNKDYYFDKKTFEQAEMKFMKESIKVLIDKSKINYQDIDLFIAGDLLNQIVVSSFVASEVKIPFLGLYNACATIGEAFVIGSNMIESKQVNNIVCAVSSHNLASEKQFRNPVEYGGPKPLRSTFTSTGGASVLLTTDKTNIKVESTTVGSVIDMDVDDPFYMGAVMAGAAADTLNRHLTDLKRTSDYYDLIVTGDLGEYGKKIFIDLMKSDYKINLKNYNDCGVMLYDFKKTTSIFWGEWASLFTSCSFWIYFKSIKNKKIKKVLLIPTGALFSPTTIFQKMSIPAIAHAISLEVVL